MGGDTRGGVSPISKERLVSVATQREAETDGAPPARYAGIGGVILDAGRGSVLVDLVLHGYGNGAMGPAICIAEVASWDEYRRYRISDLRQGASHRCVRVIRVLLLIPEQGSRVLPWCPAFRQ